MTDEPTGLAVVGIACRLPGADDADTLWRLLCRGADLVHRPTDSELADAGIDEERFRHPRFARDAGRLEAIGWFDARRFEMAPREAGIVDPQQRMLLELAAEALDDAGHHSGELEGRIGVWVGVGPPTYLIHNLLTRPDVVSTVGLDRLLLANDKGYAATRIAHKLDLTGPALTVDTACSSGLLAVHEACKALLLMECELALAGGARIIVPHADGDIREEGGILSVGGRCRAFDAAADGTVVGSGGVVVALRRLADAIADGDVVHAVVLGSAVNNDGATKVSFTAPSVAGQAEVITEALEVAGVAPDDVGMVEAHGTGTRLGDPIEVAALTEAFRRGGGTDAAQCAIGSIKSNIGHLDAAAGAAGFLKAVLAVEHGMVPPSLHVETPNPDAGFGANPFFVATRLSDWPRPRPSHRLAGVSSFGMGGTNVHVLVGEPPARTAEPVPSPEDEEVLVLSADSEPALRQTAVRLADALESRADLRLSDVAFTLQAGRSARGYRRALAVSDLRQAIEGLRSPSRSAAPRHGAGNQVAFLFPGQGVLREGMLAGLYGRAPAYRTTVQDCLTRLRDIDPTVAAQVGEALTRAAPGGARDLLDTRIDQLALFVAEYAMAALWAHRGIEPAASFGHSIGEYVAATTSGVFALDDALRLVSARGELMSELPQGAMLAVALGEDELLTRLPDRCAIASINSSRQCVAAGPTEQIAELERELGREGVARRLLRTTGAFHSPAVDPLVEPLHRLVADTPRSAPRLPYVSGVTGTWIADDEATDPAHWGRHLRAPVQCHRGIEALSSTAAVLLEVGPGRVLSALARRVIDTHEVVASHPSDSADRDPTLHAAARLFECGVDPDWSNVRGPGSRRRIRLPPTAFDRQRHWIEPGSASSASPTGQDGVRRPAAGARPGEVIGGTPAPVSSGTAPAAGPGVLCDAIGRLFEELLGVETVGPHDGFLDLGGDSLVATQLASRLSDAFGVRLTVREVMEASTPDGLATVVGSIGWMRGQATAVDG